MRSTNFNEVLVVSIGMLFLDFRYHFFLIHICLSILLPIRFGVALAAEEAEPMLCNRKPPVLFPKDFRRTVSFILSLALRQQHLNFVSFFPPDFLTPSCCSNSLFCNYGCDWIRHHFFCSSRHLFFQKVGDQQKNPWVLLSLFFEQDFSFSITLLFESFSTLPVQSCIGYSPLLSSVPFYSLSFEYVKKWVYFCFSENQKNGISNKNIHLFIHSGASPPHQEDSDQCEFPVKREYLPVFLIILAKRSRCIQKVPCCWWCSDGVTNASAGSFGEFSCEACLEAVFVSRAWKTLFRFSKNEFW